ncbi:MAG: TrkA family potassium uptake protein [Cellulosilyticum sp.]|nr:TrkA family potassium uptake protein [Cellulosilyticum sp.]
MKQFVVFGLGRFGQSVATSLAESDYEVMVVDQSEEKVQEMSTIVTQAVQADATDQETLKALGIRNFDVAIVAIGKDIQSSIMTTLLLKELNVPYVVAKASTDSHKRVLEKLGADRIISPEQDMGQRLANNLIAGNIIDYIQLSHDYSIMEIAILPEWSGQSIAELDIRAKYGINIIAIERNKEILVTPGPSYILQEGDFIVIVGNNKSIQELEAKRYE